jgi:hypothetical protein
LLPSGGKALVPDPLVVVDDLAVAYDGARRASTTIQRAELRRMATADPAWQPSAAS